MIDEVNKIGEQPDNLNIQTVTTGDEKGIDTSLEGSPLGKFKDSETLLNAYNELQSEFTRKCQKLSETEKKLQASLNTLVSGESVEVDSKDEFAWNKNISEFLQSHKNASALVEEITNEIMKDDELKSSPDGLEKAYAKVIENKFVPYDELVKNQEFLDKYVYKNEEIKNKIIKEYVASLQTQQNPINVVNHGFNSGVATNPKFGSIAEAGKFVEKMFKF